MPPVKVFIVDDSAVIRNVFARQLQERFGFTIVGTAVNGREALAKIPVLRPDVVVMDVEMPVLDGLQTLRALMASNPVPVVMLSAHTRAGSRATIEALALGAVDFVPKPAKASEMPATVAELGAKIGAAAGSAPQPSLAAPGVPRPAAGPEEGRPARSRRPATELVVIGCSTGGPGALRAVLPALPADFGAAVVVVQHMPVGFTASLAEHLDAHCALAVRHAAHNDRVMPGRVLIAPSGMEFGFRSGPDGVRVTVTEDLSPLPPGGFRPAVDTVMTRAAAVYGARVMGVLLTGMGRDGAEGMKAIRRAGGYTIAQDEDTCVVYGMPRAAVEAGAVQRVLPLAEIAGEIVRQL